MGNNTCGQCQPNTTVGQSSKTGLQYCEACNPGTDGGTCVCTGEQSGGLCFGRGTLITSISEAFGITYEVRFRRKGTGTGRTSLPSSRTNGSPQLTSKNTFERRTTCAKRTRISQLVSCWEICVPSCISKTRIALDRAKETPHAITILRSRQTTSNLTHGRWCY